MKDIDTAALELATEGQLDNLYKALPPKIAYRFRKWMKSHGASHPAIKNEEMARLLVQKIEEAAAVQDLAKNEIMTSIYDNGVVKMDFGSNVPEPVRKAAMGWAKRKGLKPIEASLNKSSNSPSSVILSAGSLDQIEGSCVQRRKWSV
jgi:hypothetical protein